MSDTKISEAVGIVGSMPGTEGFTMACFKADEVPVGTPLYLHPQPAELAEQQGVSLPPLPRTNYNACGDGSEPLYTAEQMQDYARAALAATGKQQVGENPAWRDELVREAHSRGLMEGLDSPRPQQVGEVQGDARTQFEAWQEAFYAHPLDTTRQADGHYQNPVTQGAFAIWQAAIAARQPGAQVPYGFVLDWKHAPASFTTKAGVAAGK